ncbi:MAG: Smr/MutS family protein [Pelagibacteraceae bacterium]|nr:Smr/MutS family protein [Pelagibacteraceae bacterium]MCI5079898.1 Smr/MutS family protein [Pelagibacteraceae bacterium]
MKKKPNIKPTAEDLKDWQSFIENINSIEDKDAPLDNSIIEKNNDKLFDIRKDLHGLRMHEALDVVSNTINDAIERKVRKILFITGKGLHSNKEQDPYASKDLSLLRYAVPEHIENNFSDHVIKIEQSPIKLGGSGSIIVFLKKL